MIGVISAFGAAAVGVTVFHTLGLPLPWLLGPIFACLVAALAGKCVGLFGASILGPLILTAAVTMAGGLHHRPPAEAIWAAQFFIGMSIGARYSRITMLEVRRDISAGLGFCLILIALTLVFVAVICGPGLAPGMEALLSFAPGGQAELTVLALIAGADMALVVAHHVLRIFVVILGAPLAARALTSKLRD